MSNFLENYWSLHREATAKYNDVVVLVEKGNFMECYSTDEFGIADRVAKLLNMIMTRCNKNLPVSNSNPYMVGFPKVSHEKNVPILVANGMTIMWVEQVWDHKRKVVLRREPTRIITPGTYMEQPPSSDCYWICCVHTIDTSHQISLLDTSIGHMETLLLERNEDLIWFVDVYNPIEVLLINSNPFTKKCFAPRAVYDKNIKPYNDKTYCTEIMIKVFGSCEHDYKNQTHCMISTVCLLDFVWNCHPKALTNVKFPKQSRYCNHNHLSLHNNAVSQLDVIRSERGCGLFEKVNMTNTSMGRRMLKHQLLHPMTDADEIAKQHERVEYVITKNDWAHLKCVLSKIPDIDRILKKIDMNVASISDLCTLQQSLQYIVELDIKHSGEILTEWNSIFNVQSQTFVHGYDTEYDQLREYGLQSLQNIHAAIHPFKSNCKLEYTDREGYFIATTLKKGGLITKQYTNITLKKLNTTTYCLSSEELDDKCNVYMQAIDDEKHRFSILINNWMNTISSKYGCRIRSISREVAELDCLCSKAQYAVQHNHIKPIVHSNDDCSYVKASGVTHPLLENYIGNDCELHHETVGGILLYGINGAGKSCYAKSIAVNVILAQSGFFVSAKSFEFAPFTKIFTRINCDDNMYKGMSSFSVEMSELRSILRLADINSLVIGDELCKGTEDLSAVSLVAASIKWMADNNVKYVFATHLHKLPTIDFVSNISNLRVKHMKTSYDEKLGNMIFLRSLEDGQGDPLYGIEVAKQILGFPQIANMAMMARNQLTGNSTNIISPKKSRYNKRIFMTECAHCKTTTNLHTHHINPQKNYKCQDRKQMNSVTNLVVLCNTCHEQIHNNTLSMSMLDGINGPLYKFETVTSCS